MSVVLLLDRMTLPEKLQLIEDLWENFSKSHCGFESPVWHQEFLDERRAEAESGQEKFTDWETAKEEIRRRVS